VPGASFSSVVELFHHRCDSTPDADAMYGRRGEEWYTVRWREAGERARAIACGLRARGLAPGERAAILSSTRPEWVLIDMGVLAAGGVTTTIYPDDAADQIAWILSDSGARVCFVESPALAERVESVREQLPDLEWIVLVDGEREGATALAELEREGATWDAAHPGAYEAAAEAVGPDDLATLIYTAGTTGRPKGVMLTHDAWVYEGEAIDALGLLQPSDKQYLFLPLAHAFAKVLEIAFIRVGVPTCVCGETARLGVLMEEARPTVVAAVPRTFDRVYDEIAARAAGERPGPRVRALNWALSVGAEVSRLRQQGREPRGLTAARYAAADRLVFASLRARFGGRIKFFISGGAPLSPRVAELFHAAGMLVLEGYGLTESGAASLVNRPDSFRFGTVGLPLPGCDVRIAEDGEVCLRGRGLMRGYWGREEDTAAALVDGWLMTGDVGRQDDTGFLRITDRKKDIIVTAGGKNVAPQELERRLVAACPAIAYAVIHGDRRPFCVALIALDEERAGAWARARGLSYASFAELSRLPALEAHVREAVTALNRDLASYESVHDFQLLDHPLSVGGGELTPKRSVKRRVVETHHAEILDAFYT